MKELLVAAEIGNIEKMKCIFDATEQWEMTNEWLTSGDIKKRTILHFAAIYGYMAVATVILDQIESLVKRSVTEKVERYMYINIQDYKGRTPLFYAAAEGRPFSFIDRLVKDFNNRNPRAAASGLLAGQLKIHPHKKGKTKNNSSANCQMQTLATFTFLAKKTPKKDVLLLHN